MVKIDAHLHVFACQSQKFPRESSELAPAEREETYEKFLNHMDRHGIDQAMLVQIGGTTLAEHAYLRHCIEACPDRFLGIGLVGPECAEPEAHMDELAGDGGIVGFRLGTLGGPRDPFGTIDVREFVTYRIWQHAAVQDYVLWLYVGAVDAHLVAYMVEAFPQVRVVLNHLGICPGEGKFFVDKWGRPRIETPAYNPAFHTTWRLSRYENVAMLLSGQYAFSREPFPYRDLQGWHEKLLSCFGSRRLMWATDAPWIYEEPGYGPYTKIIDELLPHISQAEKDDLMGHTARDFLRFPARKDL